MAIPDKIFQDLSTLILGGYEWRTLMVILAKTYGQGKTCSKIKLEEFLETTKIKASHISRALNSLCDRSVIKIMNYKKGTETHSSYCLQTDATKWRSRILVDMPEPIKNKYVQAFENWIKRYPNQIHIPDAKALYMNLMMDGVTPEELEGALTGYILFRLHIADRFNRDPDPLLCMYPTTFLRNDRWKEYVQFKELRRKPRL